MTGLETAIILVAFVITTAAFAFVILNMGFLTAEKAQSVISTRMAEATNALLIDNSVVATFANATGGFDQSEICMTKVMFNLMAESGALTD